MSSEKTSVSNRLGRVITFYSYKGGVGRTMALANIGVLLAQASAGGEADTRVLLVDWDLEAPGLEKYFTSKSQVELSRQPDDVTGVVDLIASRAVGKQLSWQECIVTADVQGVSIDFITAGQQTESRKSTQSYAQRVQSLNWPDLFEKANIGTYFDQLRNEWVAEYDFVLIDSRTGITDIGDICTVILPDVLVPLFVTNRQNIDGVKKMVIRARRARQSLPVDRTQLLIIPIPSRRENAEYDEYSSWEKIVANELGGFFDDWLPIDVKPMDALRRLAIPYVPKWSFGERLPIVESDRELSDPSSIGAAFSRVASLIERNLDWTNEDWDVDSERFQLRANLLEQRTEVESSERKQRELELAAEEARRDYEATAQEKEKAAKLLLREAEIKLHEATKTAKRSGRLRVAALAAFGAVAVLASWTTYSVTKNTNDERAALLERLDTERADLENRLHIALSALAEAQHEVADSQDSDRSYDAGGAAVLEAQFSPDGLQVVTALDDGTVRTWDVMTGNELFQFTGHTNLVLSAVYSSKGSTIFSVSNDGTVRLWSALDGNLIRVLRGHEDRLLSVAISPDGNRIVSGGEDGIVRLWNVVDGTEKQVLRGHEGGVLSVAISPDGNRVASGGEDGTVRLWNVVDDTEKQVLLGHEGGVLSVAVSPDGGRIVSGGEDGAALVWDLTSGRAISRFESASKARAFVTGANFSPDGNRIVTALSDNTVRLWDALTGASIARITGFTDKVTSAEFSPDGLKILAASLDGTFRIARIP